MLVQSTLPDSVDASTIASRRSFLRGALVALPGVNVAALSLVAFASGLDSAAPLIVAASVLALIELVVLIGESRRYRVGVFGVIAAILGNAVITALGFILVLIVMLVVGCSSASCA